MDIALLKAVAYVLELRTRAALHPRSLVDPTSVGLEETLGVAVGAAR